MRDEARGMAVLHLMKNMADEWTVYLLKCADGSFYCGITLDLERRLAQHEGRLSGGARYTRGRGPFEIVGSIICQGKGAALKMEAAIKALPRGKRLQLFQAHSPSLSPNETVTESSAHAAF